MLLNGAVYILLGFVYIFEENMKEIWCTWLYAALWAQRRMAMGICDPHRDHNGASMHPVCLSFPFCQGWYIAENGTSLWPLIVCWLIAPWRQGWVTMIIMNEWGVWSRVAESCCFIHGTATWSTDRSSSGSCQCVNLSDWWHDVERHRVSTIRKYMAYQMYVEPLVRGLRSEATKLHALLQIESKLHITNLIYNTCIIDTLTLISTRPPIYSAFTSICIKIIRLLLDRLIQCHLLRLNFQWPTHFMYCIPEWIVQ